MKKRLLFLCLLAFSCAVNAQTIPNGNFEAWGAGNAGTQEPTGWSTVNPFVNNALSAADSGTVFKDAAIMHLGTAAARLLTKTYSGVTGAAMGAVPGVMACGASTVSGSLIPSPSFQFSPGIAFAFRPDSIEGYIAYIPSGGDTMTVEAILTKWNTGLGARDTVGIVIVKKSGTIGLVAGAVGTYFSDTITYKKAIVPDSLTLWVQGSSYPGGHAGTKLYIDDLAFKGTDTNVSHVGINEAKDAAAISVYPNPANQMVYVTVPSFKENSNMLFVVNNIIGQQVMNVKVTGAKMRFSVTDMENGVYIYSLVSADGTRQTTGRFVVNK